MKQGHRSMPIIAAEDVSAAITFYTEKLGFDLAGQWDDDDGKASFAIVAMDAITVGLTNGTSDTDTWAAYFYLEDIDAFTDQILGKGVKLKRGPENSFYHCREVELEDPTGNTLCFAQDLKPGADGPGL